MKAPWLATAIVVGAVWLVAPTVRAQRVEFPSPAVQSPPTLLPPSGAVAPPLPTFDPYTVPSTMPPPGTPYLPPAGTALPPPPALGGPSSLYPNGVEVYNGPTFEPFTSTYTNTMRFFQEAHVDETWLARLSGQNALGINTINTWATFAIPFGWTPNPFLITPGFQLYLWDGPDSFGPEPADLPGSTYGAYIDAAWNPQVSNWFGAELEVSPGVYSDFKHVTSQSIRVLGRGLAVFTITPTFQFKAGIWYIDRLDIKLLPAVGVLWTPNPDSRYEIFFPAPKLAHRCWTVGTHNLWFYVRGEYGGGSWTIERPVIGNDEVEYDDLRVATGFDVLPECQRGLRGYFEVGYAFSRQLVYRSGMPSSFNVSDTVFIGGGLSF